MLLWLQRLAHTRSCTCREAARRLSGHLSSGNVNAQRPTSTAAALLLLRWWWRGRRGVAPGCLQAHYHAPSRLTVPLPPRWCGRRSRCRRLLLLLLRLALLR